MGLQSSDRIFPVNMENIANMADTVVSILMSHYANIRKRTSLASTGLVLTSISFHWNTNLLKHFSILKRNFLVNRYAAINKIQPPNANPKAILRHKAACPNAQSFALKRMIPQLISTKITPPTMLLSLVNLKIKRKLNLLHLAQYSKYQQIQELLPQTRNTYQPSQNQLKALSKGK